MDCPCFIRGDTIWSIRCNSSAETEIPCLLSERIASYSSCAFLHCKDDVLVCSAYVWYNYRKYKVVSLISGRSVQQNLYKVHNSDIQRNVCIDSGIEQSKIYIQLRFWNKMPGLHKDYNFYYERS